MYFDFILHTINKNLSEQMQYKAFTDAIRGLQVKQSNLISETLKGIATSSSWDVKSELEELRFNLI